MKDSIVPGDRFGMLTAVVAIKPKLWRCLCDCGQDTIVDQWRLVRSLNYSCGCARRARFLTHGDTRTATWRSWANMIRRCYQKNHPTFLHYGSRGIAVCERWRNFESFLADMGQRPPGMSIERKDVDGNYEPANCKWATTDEQNNNKRTTHWVEVDGARLSLSKACRLKGIPYDRVRQRLAGGWPLALALDAPKQQGVRPPCSC